LKAKLLSFLPLFLHNFNVDKKFTTVNAVTNGNGPSEALKKNTEKQ
jgi:hypothetical protein